MDQQNPSPAGVEEPTTQTNPFLSYYESESMVQMIRRAHPKNLRKLSSLHRAVLLEYHYRGLGTGEIAGKLNISRRKVARIYDEGIKILGISAIGQ